MRLAEVKRRLEGCGLPLAYRCFPEGGAPPLPYLIYYEGGETNFPADGSNYYNIKQVTAELYTQGKDPASEEAVEEALEGLGIWAKTEVFIDSEKCLQIVYYLEV